MFKIAEELQDKIVALEELKESNDMKELAQLVAEVQYYKDQTGIQVKTVFRE